MDGSLYDAISKVGLLTSRKFELDGGHANPARSVLIWERKTALVAHFAQAQEEWTAPVNAMAGSRQTNPTLLCPRAN